MTAILPSNRQKYHTVTVMTSSPAVPIHSHSKYIHIPSFTLYYTWAGNNPSKLLSWISRWTVVDEDTPPGSDRRLEIERTIAPRLISEPLNSKVKADLNSQATRAASHLGALPASSYEVIIEINLGRSGGHAEARKAILAILDEILGANAKTALARNNDGTTLPTATSLAKTGRVALLRLCSARNTSPMEHLRLFWTLVSFRTPRYAC